MSTVEGRDQARRLALMVGFVVVAMAVALGVFIQFVSRNPGPPEDVPRAIAIPALYATIGLLAIIGAIQRRPAIVLAAGVLCLIGTMLSVATIAFAVPGLVLILLSMRVHALPRRLWSEAVIAAAAVLLVVAAAIGLLGMTEGRCWQATGSPSNLTYTVIPCGRGVVGAASQTYAGGFDSGVLTRAGGLVELILLLSALGLTALTPRPRASAGLLPSRS
jgi:hypothetical protein